MKVKNLLALLDDEYRDAEVRLVDPSNQAFSFDFVYCSRLEGASQLPEKVIMLMPKLETCREN